jgi:DNA-binding beta-propeller fold protein YncE
MDETTLRELLTRAVEPEPPIGSLVRNSLRAGARLRGRRRAAGAAAVSVAAVVVIGAVPALTAPPATRPSVGPAQPMAYVATSAETVVPVSLRTDTALPPIKLKVLGYPQGMAITPDGKTVYVVSARGDVTPISTATNTTGTPIWVGGDPSTIVITPDGRTAYVLDEFHGIVPIDLVTGTAGKFIKISAASEIVIAQNGKIAYVTGSTSLAGVARSTIFPISTVTNTVLKPITLAPNATQFTIAPGGTTAYALLPETLRISDNPASSGPPVKLVPGTPAKLLPINLASGTVGLPVILPGTYQFAIAPDGTTAYGFGSRQVTPVDLATGTMEASIRLPAARENYSYALSPNGHTAYAYVTDGTAVVPISLTAGKALSPASLGAPRFSFAEVDFSPDGQTVWVSRYRPVTGTAYEAGTLTPVQVSTGHAGQPINLGGAPEEIVFRP